MSEVPAHLAEICRFLLIVTFTAAVAGKAGAMPRFAASTGALLAISYRAAWPVAVAVVAAEAALAVTLAAGGSSARLGAAAAILLLGAFSAAILLALGRGRRVLCNCFGGRGHPLSALDLLRNCVLIAAAIAYLLSGGRGAAEASLTALYLGLALNLFVVTAHLREIRAVLIAPA